MCDPRAEGLDLILASASPRRRALLKLAGVEFRVLSPTVEESKATSARFRELVLSLSRRKAESIAVCNPGSYVLGADTVVILGDSVNTSRKTRGAIPSVLGKPSDAIEARRMLGALSGCKHSVCTGVWLTCRDENFESGFSVLTEVEMKELSSEIIEAYIRTTEPFGKAGAYAIQGIGASLIKGITGSYTNVVGLPLSEILDLLEERGLWRPDDFTRGTDVFGDS